MKVRKVRVAFSNNIRGIQTYVYFTTLDSLHIGDYVIVDSKNKPGMARVIQYVNDSCKDPCYSWVLEKVELEALRIQLKEQIDSCQI